MIKLATSLWKFITFFCSVRKWVWRFVPPSCRSDRYKHYKILHICDAKALRTRYSRLRYDRNEICIVSAITGGILVYVALLVVALMS